VRHLFFCINNNNLTRKKEEEAKAAKEANKRKINITFDFAGRKIIAEGDGLAIIEFSYDHLI
jgi:hypothetical protein